MTIGLHLKCTLLTTLTPTEAADLMEEILDEHATDFIEQLSASYAASIVDAMESTEQADLLGGMNEAEAGAILARMDPLTSSGRARVDSVSIRCGRWSDGYRISGLPSASSNPYEIARVLLQEISVGIMNGLVLCCLIAAAAWLWKGNVYLGLVVGVALAASTMLAVFLRGTVPLLLKRFKVDPAVASGPILTTVHAIGPSRCR